MPSPKEGESESQFVSRCVSYIISTEHMFPNTPEGRKKAAGRCHGIYRSNKKKAILEELNSIKEDIVEIKSIIVEKVITPPLKNVRDVEIPKDSKKPWYRK